MTVASSVPAGHEVPEHLRPGSGSREELAAKPDVAWVAPTDAGHFELAAMMPGVEARRPKALEEVAGVASAALTVVRRKYPWPRTRPSAERTTTATRPLCAPSRTRPLWGPYG